MKYLTSANKCVHKWFASFPISVYLFIFFFCTDPGGTFSNLLRGNISSDT